jgi:hypothetical protein
MLEQETSRPNGVGFWFEIDDGSLSTKVDKILYGEFDPGSG